MTLNELFAQCKELVEAGLGDCKVIKATDDEGNSFIPAEGIQEDLATGGLSYFEVIAEEDYDEYEEDELQRIITVR